MKKLKRPVIEEVYEGSAVRAVTRHEGGHLIYEVFDGDALRWSRLVYFVENMDQRKTVAREQDAFASRLAAGHEPG